MNFYDGTFISLRYRQLVYLRESDRDVVRRRIEFETEMTLAVVGGILFDLCTSIENNGNKGYKIEALIDWGVAAGYPEEKIRKVLKCKDALQGIVFISIPERKRDFNGYGVRKNPPWQQSWCELYGYDNELAQMWVATLWDEAIEHERQLAIANARPRDEVFGINLASIPTLELGKRYALLCVKAEQEFALRDEVPQFIGNLYAHYDSVLKAEIAYRAKTLPEGDEKNMCHDIVAKGWTYFFTFSTFQWLRTSNEIIDIDWSQPLPISLEAQHAQIMTDKNLLWKFFKLLDPDHAKQESISNDSVQLILGTLRKLLKNARSDW